ncbi:MAG: alcohol dehydrogenase catalytic domain-containing protein [Dehalococcoidales bacterium]|nr:alcohol dehydrogenase catalytic domain-containing protein [Dehalococcoidales bacterium]
MKAVVWEDRLVYREDYPRPRRGPGEALVRVELAGICNTDLEITRGYMGFRGVLGHEFVGFVEESERPELLRLRVVGEINCPCGACQLCLSGLGRHCPERTVLGIAGRDGAFAEYLTLPLANLWIVSPDIPDERAVFAEPVAACYEVLEQVHVQPVQTVVVLGDGKIGLLMAQILAQTGCEVLAAGHHREKLLILDRLGIPTVLSDALPPRTADVVIECTGSAEGLALAARTVRPRGTVVLKSTVAGETSVNMAPFVVDEITVVGSRCGPFPPALRALADTWLDTQSLITAEYPLAKAEEAFAEASRPGALKVLLRP